MAGNTPNLDLYLPGGGSSGLWVPDEVADIDKINQNMQKIDTAIGNLWGMANPANQRFRSTGTGDVSLSSTTHPLQLGPSSGSNMRFDNNEIQSVLNGAADAFSLNALGGNVNIGDDGSWVKAGDLQVARIHPTSANPAAGTATIGANGKVNCTGCTSVRINNAFPGNEIGYEVVVDLFDISGTATNLYAGLATGGVTETSVSTGWLGFGAAGWGSNGGANGTSNPPITGGDSNSTGGIFIFRVFNPMSGAERTKMIWEGVHDLNSGERFVGWLQNTQISANDGFRFGVNGGGTFQAAISIRQLH